MRVLILIAAAFSVAAIAPDPADARGRDRDQDAAFRATQEGRILPLRAIEARIVPRMSGAEYLGPEFNAAAALYRLKFMRNGRVIWIDVDARTGSVVNQSGN